ncbi:MAG: menaquinone biosynthesis protein [Thermoleophilia bacterium]|nr:menaquinone biosynthesis protein [Thermoleophilia bacterium]MDH3724421.1 menaquinone biosynthesis protein [Thermoleophilia bacterium]
MSTLRVGRIAALNMYPIYHGLENGPRDDLTFEDGVPTQLNDALLRDELDISAVSSISYARNADQLKLLPVASISANGAVDSIQVFSNVPFQRLRHVAVTPDSATSVALLRVLVGAEPEPFRTLEGDPASALEDVDGVMLIGDQALEGLRAGLGTYRTDLSEVWRARTGLPMVFAVWAARGDVAVARPDEVAALSQRLRSARGEYAKDPELVVVAAAERFPFSVEYIRSYFRRLRFDFGPAERAGLEHFLQLARSAGLLDEVPRLAA